MATRKDFMIAQDIVRYANIINDHVDHISYIARGTRSDNGLPKINKATRQPWSTKQKIEEILSAITTANIYKDAVPVYISKLGDQKVGNALAVMGIDRTEFVSEYNELTAALGAISKRTIDTEEDLEQLAGWIDANIEKLPLIRRRWAL